MFMGRNLNKVVKHSFEKEIDRSFRKQGNAVLNNVVSVNIDANIKKMLLNAWNKQIYQWLFHVNQIDSFNDALNSSSSMIV